MTVTDTAKRLESYEQVEAMMRQVVQNAFYEGSFFQHLLDGRYSENQIRYFAIQYSYYSRHFPRVLGAAISAMEPVDSWWVPLADNLWDEAGRGLPGRSHEKLYQTFLSSVEPNLETNSAGLPIEPMAPAVSKAIRTFIQFFYNASPLEAMAAVGLGSEFFAGEVMGTICRGLQHERYNQNRRLDVTFWEVHADEHEPRHYQLCKEILVQYSNPDDLECMYGVGKQIAESEALMYEELHADMMSLSK